MFYKQVNSNYHNTKIFRIGIPFQNKKMDITKDENPKILVLSIHRPDTLCQSLLQCSNICMHDLGLALLLLLITVIELFNHI